MPITIEYQPSFVDAGLMAYQGGRGQYDLQQDQLGLQQQALTQRDNQFQQQLRFAAYQESNRDRQRQDLLYANQYGQNLQYMAGRERNATELERQRIVQQGYDNSARMQLQGAMLREQAAVARLQMTQKNAVAMKQLDSLESFISKTQPTYEQVEQLYNQFEQVHGFHPGNFRTDEIMAAQQAQEDTAKQQKVLGLVQGFGIDEQQAESWLTYDPNMGWTLSEDGKILAQSHLNQKKLGIDEKRYSEQVGLQRQEVDANYDLKRQELELKRQEAGLKPLEQQQKVVEEAYKRQADIMQRVQKYQKAAAKAAADAAAAVDGPKVEGKPEKPKYDPRVDMVVLTNTADVSYMPVGVPFLMPNGIWMVFEEDGQRVARKMEVGASGEIVRTKSPNGQ